MRTLFSLLLPTLLTSCYSLSVASQYLCLVSKAKPFSKIQDISTKEQLLFERTQSIKNFAVEQLGLRPTKNYSRYIRLERDYLTVVVSAAPALGFEDYLWNYLFVGKLPYQGYFILDKAKKEAKRLHEHGYDVFMRPVDAFSTLGYVRDPLFSYMADYSEARLADLIIHESFHATLFIKGDIGFNESLANLVGKYGSQLYMEDKYGQAPEKSDPQDRLQFRSMVLELKQQLQAVYDDNSLTGEQKKQHKTETIITWQEQFRDPHYQEHFAGKNYAYIADYPINNAYLALFSLYEDPDDFLKNTYNKILEKAQGSRKQALRQFIQLCRDLAKKHGRKTRAALKKL